ncbi:hypothetical protein [Sedimentisphaera salicampi]|uniref:hypothetical protein n=1 Tax=Sedimentisphaera salicampi TaxID=1941349 RepID=UPI000B9B4E16|nr:hypothetical protein [Sedimentisphaera salicampi]OXU15459.1 hypothetical protein SMSP1_00940 [Sedimentisphaera salicampi]
MLNITVYLLECLQAVWILLLLLSVYKRRLSGNLIIPVGIIVYSALLIVFTPSRISFDLLCALSVSFAAFYAGKLLLKIFHKSGKFEFAPLFFVFLAASFYLPATINMIWDDTLYDSYFCLALIPVIVLALIMLILGLNRSLITASFTAGALGFIYVCIVNSPVIDVSKIETEDLSLIKPSGWYSSYQKHQEISFIYLEKPGASFVNAANYFYPYMDIQSVSEENYVFDKFISEKREIFVSHPLLKKETAMIDGIEFDKYLLKGNFYYDDPTGLKESKIEYTSVMLWNDNIHLAVFYVYSQNDSGELKNILSSIRLNGSEEEDSRIQLEE